MTTYTIPLESNDLKNILDNIDELHDKVEIDIHDAKLPIADMKMKSKAIFTYLRNTNIFSHQIKINFDNCTFEEKEAFLLLFMQAKYRIDLLTLKHTWIKILKKYDKCDFEDYSILTDEEIDKFIENNKDYISNLYQFIISIPIGSINLFNERFKNGMNANLEIDVNELEHSSFCDINIYSIIAMMYEESFIYLITENKLGVKPLFYDEYFKVEDNWFLQKCIDLLPYFKLLEYMFVGEHSEHLEVLKENIDEFLNTENPEENKEE